MGNSIPDESRHIFFHAPELLPGRPASESSRSPAGSLPRAARVETSEARKLGTLVDVSQALAGSVNLHAGLSGVLEVLARRCGAVRGTVALLDEQTKELQIRASIGLSRDSLAVRYRLGEGITGTVAQSGEAIVVPLISQDARFLHRAAGRTERRGRELSFVCVPVALHREVVGTLSIEVIHKADRDFERLLKFLKVVASMISQGIRIHRLLETERRKLVAENTQLRHALHQKYEVSNMVGNSSPMRQMYEEMARVAGSNATVLIRGESGTGKELIASAIHYHSSRAKKPFIKVNCAALPETLIESELFGHERGSFTGAESRKKGRFETANGGTLFLDEIGELSPATQAKAASGAPGT